MEFGHFAKHPIFDLLQRVTIALPLHLTKPINHIGLETSECGQAGLHVIKKPRHLVVDFLTMIVEQSLRIRSRSFGIEFSRQDAY